MYSSNENCYECENCFQCDDSYKLKNCKGLVNSVKCKNCIDCVSSYRLKNCALCINCIQCFKCDDCNNCFNCVCCSILTGKREHIFNMNIQTWLKLSGREQQKLTKNNKEIEKQISRLLNRLELINLEEDTPELLK